MDGRGCWVDDVFIERLWRSLKYEDIYLSEYLDLVAAGEYMLTARLPDGREVSRFVTLVSGETACVTLQFE
jgi:hypothetical protein